MSDKNLSLRNIANNCVYPSLCWVGGLANCYGLCGCVPGTRFSDGDGSSNEVQRTMLELINQLDGFDPRGNIKVLMATNR